ncbi:MAG: Stage V sporulation protein E [Candidatus Woesebacteria bacterium GW2011_GWA1_37_8]|uniref:Probable peptidoglycan glycosyltransferase FtsW n=2 Tax=Candidatus Woeseibacteriota TaxID=1752722 RepID=A0A0G0L5W4_9BACT|nr:MAG: Stage V sporulation protein E [Microgenomates group bacterium GW2011_GWC1_37_12b]KKQ43882.1 MAG: Stage V sporulation protein E [Candidatus Woesebacteria bacterium GW2011_GWA1_37_8]KKQ87403.1 MAG: Stage V sporulation protein E [Candidatus Woesebacteria bacterium GW2011_GWB1_38_8b]
MTLTGIGLIAVADASAPLAIRQFDDKFFFIKQQVYVVGIGLICMFILSFVNYKLWEKYAVLIFFASLGLLLLVLIPGFGNKYLGARRWLMLGPINFQPSELVKLTLSIYIAKLAVGNKKILAYFIPLGIVSLLVMLQPDMGTAMILVGAGLIQIFAAGVNIFSYFGMVLVGIVSGVALIFTSDYRRDRLISFINHNQNIESSYHIRQVLLAIGSGGLFGVGLGQSRQKFLFIPESASDSIFAIIAEEAGFIRSGLLLLIFFLLVFEGYKVALQTENKFGKILAIGITSWIGLQTVLNLSSMLSITPITGVPLPFISFGGTSIVMLLASSGILLNISKYAKKQDK